MWFFPSFDPSCYSYWFAVATVVSRSPTNREGLPGVLWKKGTLAKYRREQRNSILFLENRGTKIYKLENGNIVNKLGEQMRETCGNMGTKANFGKGTKEQGPLWETCNRAAHVAHTSFLVFIDRTAASEKQTKS